jgi:hypothetical protein
MASTTTTASNNLAGVWLGELSSALHGTWQAVAVAATHGLGEDDDPRLPCQQQQRPWRGDDRSSSNNKALRGAAAAGTVRREGDVARCGGAMSDTTLYLLLDRFAPS